ncbi:MULTISPECIES: HNH endonuclease signature motif containing protein [unclassified Mameliella]|uniref:HNH endonuclease signature motif containing protein n=1 Tax=unclassified Mameliella TaxID=2630630 RepID=UPI00273DCEFA|nr:MULTISPECIES: HNH endonuclease signature motif containing protein [unclassified Mameliella]
MKGRAITYSDAELFWIGDNCHLPRRELHREFVDIWSRPDVSQANLTALCKRKGWLTGRTGRFQKGQAPHNKGKPFNPPGSEKGRFKKGERRGVAVDLYKPIGTERLSKDGYLERKIHDGMPLQSRWRAVHLIRWEEAHGPVPEGHALKCLDGDRANTDPTNWKCIPRSMLPRLSGRWTTGYDDAPDELKPTIMATAELEQAVRVARKGGTT